MSFSDKVVLISGAGSGIGRATAMAFAKEGAKVVTVDKNKTSLEDLAEKCEFARQNLLTIHGDICVEHDVEEIISKTIQTFKKLDILVNNAGIFHFTNIFQENLMQNYDEIMNCNLRGTIYLTKLAVPHIIETKGNIVNISSVVVSAVPGRQSFLCYGIAKAGLEYFSLDLAKELAVHGVRVNIVSPGAVNTNIMAHKGLDDWWDQMKSRSPLDRVSEPEEIAELIVFLAKAKGIHGSNFKCDNGFSL